MGTHASIAEASLKHSATRAAHRLAALRPVQRASYASTARYPLPPNTCVHAGIYHAWNGLAYLRLPACASCALPAPLLQSLPWGACRVTATM